MTSPHNHIEAAQHRLARMTGRDPHEAHRAATPLELLFDLTLVIGFGSAASQLAHFLADGHVGTGLAAFAFAMFAICWAWINYSWFSSAYDTDDWAYRLATFVEMIGVIVLSLGIPRAFKSIDSGTGVDNGVMVLGYVIMRLAMLFLWLRAASQDPPRRKTCLTYAVTLLVAQIGWVGLLLARPGWTAVMLVGSLLLLIELSGPVIAEAWIGEGGTPWHAHHIAERHGLLAIIGLGEGIIGTVAAVSAIVQHQGWSPEAIMMCAAGVGLTFGMWWMYFVLPAAPVLHKYRDRAFLWGYLHIALFAAIAATGAGLHVVGYFIEHKAKIGAVATMTAAALPVGLFIIGIYAIYTALLRRFDTLHSVLLSASAAVLCASVAPAWMGASLTLCLAILTFAPAVTVVGYELVGVHHAREALAQELGNGAVRREHD
jgi:low temperature requirement protein LtrA